MEQHELESLDLSLINKFRLNSVRENGTFNVIDRLISIIKSWADSAFFYTDRWNIQCKVPTLYNFKRMRKISA